MGNVEIGESSKVLKIVAELLADKQKRPVPQINFDSMSNEEASRILKIVEQEISDPRAVSANKS